MAGFFSRKQEAGSLVSHDISFEGNFLIDEPINNVIEELKTNPYIVGLSHKLSSEEQKELRWLMRASTQSTSLTCQCIITGSSPNKELDHFLSISVNEIKSIGIDITWYPNLYKSFQRLSSKVYQIGLALNPSRKNPTLRLIYRHNYPLDATVSHVDKEIVSGILVSKYPTRFKPNKYSQLTGVLPIDRMNIWLGEQAENSDKRLKFHHASPHRKYDRCSILVDSFYV